MGRAGYRAGDSAHGPSQMPSVDLRCVGDQLAERPHSCLCLGSSC